jgi:hypothetical protein
MGYRSDVHYVIAFPNDEEMASFIAQAKALSKTTMSAADAIESGMDGKEPLVWGDMVSALDECQIKWKGEARLPFIGFYAESVKWYPTYADVHSHESLIALAMVLYEGGGQQMTYAYRGENEPPVTVSKIAFQFMRVGEEADDIEERERGTSLMTGNSWVQRRIRTWKEIEKALSMGEYS